MRSVLRIAIPLPVLAVLLLVLQPRLGLAITHYPNMVYGARQELAPGVTWRTATHDNPKWSIHIIEIDMTNPSVRLVPVHKQSGRLEKTSAMAERVHAIAAVNAGYFNTKPPYNSVSLTRIDGKTIATGSPGVSAIGFGGPGQSRPFIIKADRKAPEKTDWSPMMDAIGGRGYFVTRNGVVEKIDNEGREGPHNASRHPRTVIGYATNPYRVWLVTVDGRQKHSVGMTYRELARLMADLGAEVSLNLDGGGSTTAWVKGKIVNSPSDGRERSVVSAWAVVPGCVIDNRDPGVTWGGAWTRSPHEKDYGEDHFVATGSPTLSWIAWRPNLKQPGLYKVEAWWADAPGRASAAPFQIKHRDGQAAFLADQRVNGGQWNTLGTFPFLAGNDGLVMLSNTVPGTISADAIRFTRVGDLPAGR